jgi:monoamine oxidase
MGPDSKGGNNVLTYEPHKLPVSMFSHVTTTNNPCRILTTAGLVGADENGDVPVDIDEQIALAIKSLRQCLEAAGARVCDVFKLVYYIVDYDPKNRRHPKHITSFLNGHRPATTMVPVPALADPRHKFEIEAYAAIEREPPKEVDVVIVGAGLSGLKAAYDIQQAGLSFVVIEARDRVGGKTWSVDPLGDGKVVDIGAAWINDTNQSEIYALAKSLGLELTVQNTVGNIIQQDLTGELSLFEYGGAPTRLAEQKGPENLVYIRDLAEKVCQQLDIHDPVGTGGHLDKLTLEEWCRAQVQSETALASVKMWSRQMLGLEASEISALYFLNYCKSGGGLLRMRSDYKHGGQFLRFVKGKLETAIHTRCILTR